jgi:NADP-dependent 3-hydroxy acid dehydrogenase YdfG
LGLEIAKNYAIQKGFSVVLAARREKNLQDLVKEFQNKGAKNVEYCVTDATDEKSVKNLIDFTIKKFERIDIGLIN